MTPVPIHAAKTHLSRLIERACAGEDIVIARGDVPVVRLVAIKSPASGRQFGALRGQVCVDESFFDPLPAEDLAAWEGR